MLREGPVAFEQLRQRLGVRVHDLEEDLRHLARSVRRRDERLAITPAACGECGFEFAKRVARVDTMKCGTPGRCPECRSRRIRQTRLHLV